MAFNHTSLFALSAHHSASAAGNTVQAEILLKNGADVNALISFGTVLDYAVRSKNLEMAKLLILCGADVNVTNDRLYTCLDTAMDYEAGYHYELIHFLLKLGGETHYFKDVSNYYDRNASSRQWVFNDHIDRFIESVTLDTVTKTISDF